MKTKIIKIGNSKGLRLSKTILEKYEIDEAVELVLEKEYIMIKPIKNPREKWAQKFQQMSKNGDDNLLIDDVFEDEDFEEWN